jgi:hypothetical protein
MKSISCYSYLTGYRQISCLKPHREALHFKSCVSLNHNFLTILPNLVAFLTVFLRTKKRILFPKHCVLVFLYMLDEKRHHNTPCFQMLCTFARMQTNSIFSPSVQFTLSRSIKNKEGQVVSL